MAKFMSSGPTPETQPSLTDAYFKHSRDVVIANGDCEVTYAVFMRRPVTFAGRLAIEWINAMAASRGAELQIQHLYVEGAWIGAGEPMCYITGPLSVLVDLETIFLQRLGPACVAAYNAYNMCMELPKVAFLAMDARHCAGSEMAELMAYGASVGAAKARAKANAVGFVGCAADATAHFFGQERGIGTMPHALIGYAGSTLRAAKLFQKTLPNAPLTVLVDYFGQEITDAIAVASHFQELSDSGQLSLRIDTHGGRYVEGLDTQSSYAVLERNAPKALRGYRTDDELRLLLGTGVSAAAVWHMREQLNCQGFENVKIVASSGFGPDKCRVFGLASAPVDMVGTGSFLPQTWSQTYATADIVSYDGKPRVKAGREFLISK